VSEARYSVYILRCADGSLYTGIATDVQRRLQEHQRSARGSKYLRGRGPLQLVYEQAVAERANALRIEHRIKQLDRRQKEALIAGDQAVSIIVDVVTRGQTPGGSGG
jgi:putative endonuclease